MRPSARTARSSSGHDVSRLRERPRPIPSRAWVAPSRADGRVPQVRSAQASLPTEELPWPTRVARHLDANAEHSVIPDLPTAVQRVACGRVLRCNNRPP